MGMIKLPNHSIEYFKNNLDEIFESGNFAEGKWNEKLSKYTMELTNAKQAIPTNSNGSGIVCLLNIYRYYYGRTKVLIQSNTMYGVKTMVASGGCSIAGYINCSIQTLMPRYEDVRVILERYSLHDRNQMVLLLSHIGGIVNPDIKNIAKLCKSLNVVLIEDCAHSYCATLGGKHSGLFGDAGVYSFYATKAIPAGEGGIVVTKNSKIGKLVSEYAIYDRFNQQMEIGHNIRISEIQALLIYSAVKEWQQIFENKKEIAKKYIAACDEYGINYIKQEGKNISGNYYKFTIYTTDTPIKDVFPRLKTVTSPVYDYSIGVRNELSNYHACLPIWYGQDVDIANRVISELTNIS